MDEYYCIINIDIINFLRFNNIVAFITEELFWDDSE